MTNGSLAASSILRATKRLVILPVLLEAEEYSAVVLRAKEQVDLALRGMLRQVGLEPSRWRDLGGLLRRHRNRLPPDVAADVDRLAGISEALRKDRKLSFYRASNFVRDDYHTREDAQRAMDAAAWVVEVATRVIEQRQPDGR